MSAPNSQTANDIRPTFAQELHDRLVMAGFTSTQAATLLSVLLEWTKEIHK